MFKGGTNTSALTQPHGINVNSAVYGKAVRLIYGLTQAQPDLIWYNGWETASSPSNSALAAVTGQSSKKKTTKKSGLTFYSAAVDLLLGHAPIRGVLSAWYNNQKFACVMCSAAGFLDSSGVFAFTPVAGNSQATFTGTVPGTGPYTVTVPGFVSDLNDVKAAGVNLSPAISPPGVGQYSVTTGGVYEFNAADAGAGVVIVYRKTGTGGAATVAGIIAVTVAETFSATFNDYGDSGSRTVYGTWERPLWNRTYGVPGRIDAGAYFARDPYSWWWDGSTAQISTPTALGGKPVTVYYGVPAIYKSDGTFFSSTLTPLALLNLEFEQEMASGAEYASWPSQQIVQKWVSGVGSTRFDLGGANAMPSLNLETIGAFVQWPNGDCDVADVILDVFASGPVLV